MAGEVKTRRYDSSGRQQAAARTRVSIIATATELFLEHGYSAATIPMIARAASVSVPTVYKMFGSKAQLAKAAFDVAIAGDHDDVPMRERGVIQAIRAEHDPRRKLERYGRFLAETLPRHVPVQLVVRDAAATDKDAALLWNQLCGERLRAMSWFAGELRDGGLLRKGVTLAEARDVLWTHNAPELFELLVIQRGWSARRYGTWVTQQLIAALLPE